MNPTRRPRVGDFFAQRAARRQVLTDWRSIDLEAEEKARQNSSKTLKDTVGSVLKELKLDRRRSEAEIVKVWNHLIDPNVTAHAQPVTLRNGTLIVNVDHSTWLDEIVRYRRHEILNRLQHSFGKEAIRRISFRIG